MFLRGKTGPGCACIIQRSTVLAEGTQYESTLPVDLIANPGVFFRAKRP